MSEKMTSPDPVEPKRRGRKPGSPKVVGSGRRKGVSNLLGREARQALADESGYLDLLIRTCSGKAIKMSGPTGKPCWFHPGWKDRKWAAELIVGRLIPAVSATEISGPGSAPIEIEATTVPLSEREMLRQLATFLVDSDDPTAQAIIDSLNGQATTIDLDAVPPRLDDSGASSAAPAATSRAVDADAEVRIVRTAPPAPRARIPDAMVPWQARRPAPEFPKKIRQKK